MEYIVLFAIILSFTCAAAAVFVIVCLLKFAPCCKQYLARRNVNLPFLRQLTHDPCVTCQLIEMGEMACYNEVCPGCGRVPPSVNIATSSNADAKQV